MRAVSTYTRETVLTLHPIVCAIFRQLNAAKMFAVHTDLLSVFCFRGNYILSEIRINLFSFFAVALDSISHPNQKPPESFDLGGYSGIALTKMMPVFVQRKSAIC